MTKIENNQSHITPINYMHRQIVLQAMKYNHVMLSQFRLTDITTRFSGYDMNTIFKVVGITLEN